MKHLALVSLALLAPSLSAQGYAVTPGWVADHEGTSNNTIPFWGTTGYYRYQQSAKELTGTPRVFTEIAWRRDGTLTTAYPARTIDMEISLADTDTATFSTTFASNYANAPVNVFLRKLVNTPDHSAVPSGLPAPWTFACAFDAPFVYTGAKDLLYDITCYSFTTTGTYALDAASGTAPSVTAGFSSVGTGCTTSTGVMSLRANHTLTAAGSLTLIWNLTKGPATASTSILVGIVNPNFPLPGLCGSGTVYTDASLLNLAGTTSAAGAFNTTSIAITPYDPAWQGLTLTAQAASLDASQPVFPLAVSNGITSVVPGLPSAVTCNRLYSSTVAATTGSLGANYALVTRFKY